MRTEISADTQAILLLTAPLITGRGAGGVEILRPTEYRRLARQLHSIQREPADLIGVDADSVMADCGTTISAERLRALLGRGFLLSQALERWHSRSIWVLSRADSSYPVRLRSRLRENSPPVVYGSGDAELLNGGGLAVVGSREVDEKLVGFTERVGSLAAVAGRTTVSGGARGIDEAAMRGAAEAGGRVVGVLADRLERAVLNRENRNLLRNGQLVLISPYDPAAGFNVGYAMQRNKLIYALADAALVVSSDYQKGGTWSGAVEQLEKLHFVPVFVRSNGQPQRGIEALQSKGAIPWPDPSTPDELNAVISTAADRRRPTPAQAALFVREEINAGVAGAEAQSAIHGIGSGIVGRDTEYLPDEAVPDEIRVWFGRMTTARSLAEIAGELQVPRSRASAWLKRLIAEGLVERLTRPARYRSQAANPSLFDVDSGCWRS
jgi:predicted Rossmann fold nucleotide-binding protein DprA/Smf involved in DNA uptake